ATDAVEGRVAELATRRRGKAAESTAQGEHASMLAGEDGAPLFLGRGTYHGHSLGTEPRTPRGGPCGCRRPPTVRSRTFLPFPHVATAIRIATGPPGGRSQLIAR